MEIIVYTKTGCPWCKEVLKFLKDKSIGFEERNVTDNKNYFNEMIEKSGQNLAPTLDVDGEVLADSDAKEVKEFLKNKGIF